MVMVMVVNLYSACSIDIFKCTLQATTERENVYTKLKG